MTGTAAELSPVHAPPWMRRSRLLHVVCYLSIALAAATELVLIPLHGGSPVAVGGVLITVLGAGLAWRWPWVGLPVSIAGPIVVAAVSWTPIAEWTMVVFALFSAVLRGVPAVRATAIAILGVYAATVLYDGHLFSVDAIAAASAALAAGALSGAISVQRRYLAAVEQRADDALAARELEAERRVSEERLRIARDLHDVVGHQVAVLSMQVGAAEVTARSDPSATLESLRQARTSVKAVLLETQRILDVLRDDGEGQSLSPTPGYDGLGALIESFRAIGLAVSADIDPRPADLDPEVDVAVYRLVQEALTNAQRHGDGVVTVTVAVRQSDRRIAVDVANEHGDAATASEGSGYGLIGMRERVSSAGGHLTVRDSDGRFEVTAELAINGRALA